MTALFLQVRLDSRRLPGKALRLLGGKLSIEWALDALAPLPADIRVLLTDSPGAAVLGGLARRRGWLVFIGPKEDVLERFAQGIRHFCPDRVIRATGDNPLVSLPLALEAVEQFEKAGADYCGLREIPLGAGVEVIRAQALLEAAGEARDPYEREHVCPFLYRRPERYRIWTPPASRPARGRVTLDTPGDLARLEGLFRDYRTQFPEKPPLPDYDWVCRRLKEEEIESEGSPGQAAPRLLLWPSLWRGGGLGHLIRCARTVQALPEARLWLGDCGGKGCFSPAEAEAALAGLSLPPDRILSPEAGLALLKGPSGPAVLLDRRRTRRQDLRLLPPQTPTAALDEGGRFRRRFVYLLDSLPRLSSSPANLSSPALLEAPRSGAPPAGRNPGRAAGDHPSPGNRRFRLLVSFGGEDPAGLGGKTLKALSRKRNVRRLGAAFPQGMDITFLSPCLSAASPPGKPARLPEGPGFFFEPFLPNLKDRLGEYDGVLCSFGLTAFEARRAGVPAILVSPSLYHHRLAKKGGFPRAGLGRFSFSAFLAALVKPKASPAFEESPDGKSPGGERSDEKSPELPDFLRGLLLAFPSCPGCGASKGRGDPVIGRFPERTYHRCRRCGLVYVNLHRLPSGDYGSSYFEEDYRRQYGRTYLEDFPQLRRLARERLALIESLLRREKTSPPALLDIGCAYGAFLVEAARRGFKTGGVDMSPEAAAHVRGEWGIPVWAGPVEQWEPALALGTEGDSPLFDVVASWYTLEHLKDPGDFLNRAVQWLKPGGILALSTPNLAGVSGRFRRRSFLLRNPADHYTLWTPRTARRLLAALGCPVRKVRITGHHPERFPLLGSRLSRRGDQGGRKREGTLLYRGLLGLSRVFALGDTFEVYAVKEKK